MRTWTSSRKPTAAEAMYMSYRGKRSPPSGKVLKAEKP